MVSGFMNYSMAVLHTNRLKCTFNDRVIYRNDLPTDSMIYGPGPPSPKTDDMTVVAAAAA